VDISTKHLPLSVAHMRVTITVNWLGENSLPLFTRKAIRTVFTNLGYPVMTRIEKLIAGLYIIIAVAVFFALISYLGGYGALISAFITVGLLNYGLEQETEDNHQ
jgi:hypothetical protein